MYKRQLLIYRYRNETVHVEPWGANAVRVRATKNPAFPENDWALASRPSAQAEITVSPEGAVLTNGKIRLSLSNNGKITVYNQKDERILEEDTRKFCALKIEAREFRPIPGGDYHLTARFQSLDPNERIYGCLLYTSVPIGRLLLPLHLDVGSLCHVFQPLDLIDILSKRRCLLYTSHQSNHRIFGQYLSISSQVRTSQSCINSSDGSGLQ